MILPQDVWSVMAIREVRRMPGGPGHWHLQKTHGPLRGLVGWPRRHPVLPLPHAGAGGGPRAPKQDTLDDGGEGTTAGSNLDLDLWSRLGNDTYKLLEDVLDSCSAQAPFGKCTCKLLAEQIDND